MDNVCLACGYPHLSIGPTRDNDYSYDICPSCGFEFGVTDMDLGYSYEQWRKKWIQDGMPWWSKSRNPPPNWNPREQSLNVGKKV